MRVNLIEQGKIYHKTGQVQEYTAYYTQPITNRIRAWLFHYIFEAVGWFVLTKRKKLNRGSKLQLSTRLEERCYYLTNKNVIVLRTEYKEMD